jgi:predicted nucleic acid-binding protein
MAYLADTNVIIRRMAPADIQYQSISSALDLLHQQGETVYITAQNLIEFQALATRPVEANGWGLAAEVASAEARKLEVIFPLLAETPAIYPLWRNLVDTFGVVGRQVYDARLVAVMQAYGVSHMLTLDPTGFRRYSQIITVVEPKEVR